MNFIVDANVFQAYYQKNLGLVLPEVTEDPTKLFENFLKGIFKIYFDEGTHIKSEWEAVVEREWFGRWFQKLLTEGDVHFVKLTRCDFIKHIQGLGFPTTKDIRYLQAAKSVTSIGGNVFLVTEDIDFYEPKLKLAGLKKRHKIMKNGSTKITNFLRKKQNINVNCISNGLLIQPV